MLSGEYSNDLMTFIVELLPTEKKSYIYMYPKGKGSKYSQVHDWQAVSV